MSSELEERVLIAAYFAMLDVRLGLIVDTLDLADGG